ncbi:MAG: DUF402 domain-containing protein [Microbacterium sp.]
MEIARPTPGTEVQLHWRKWDGSPHWHEECVYLGSDEHGDWSGQPVGWLSERPGKSFVASAPSVRLIVPAGDYALIVNRDHPTWLRIYIDLGWDIRWTSETLIEGIDMDLDVIRHESAENITEIVDQDEWEEHSAKFGYPADVMTHLEALAADLATRVRAQEAPFDDATADPWLDRLAALNLDNPLP